MKKLEFETSRGRFVLVDNPILPQAMSIITKYIKLSEISEEKASGIVDSNDEYGVIMYQNYQTTSMQYFDEQITAIESLHSLLKSKGIHLFENPFDLNEQLDCNCDMCYQKLEDTFDEAEQKTFYNPYIFMICMEQ